MAETVLLERSGAVATLTLNRPEARNAMNQELMTRLTGLLRHLDQDPEVHAIVLTGTDPVFCSGADLKEVRAQGFWEMIDRVALSTGVHEFMPEMSTPVVAAVNGHALAGGCGLAMSCDLVIASEEAQFGYPEVQRGLVAALVMVSLERLVGRRMALELLLTGRRVSAQEALGLGMINRAVPRSEVLPQARALAEQLAAYPRGAVATTKRLFYRVGDIPYPAALKRARDVNLLVRTSSEGRAGASAFVEKRDQVVRGDESRG